MNRYLWKITQHPYRSTALAAVLSLALLGGRAEADVTYVPSNSLTAAAVGDSIGRSMAGLAAGAARSRQAVGEINLALQEARGAYLTDVRRGVFDGEAATKFRQLLFRKDFMLASLDMMTKMQENTFGGQGAERLVLKMAGAQRNQIDGGVPAAARKPYDRWVDTLVRRAGGNSLVLLQDPSRLTRAFEEAQPEYVAFARVRDFAELHRADLHAKYFTSPQSLVQFALQFPTGVQRTLTDEEAAAAFAVVRERFGDDIIREVGSAYAQAGLTEWLTPMDATQLGVPASVNGPREIVLHMLAARGDEYAYTLNLVRRGVTDQHWTDAEARVEAMLAQYGVDKVRDVVTAIRQATQDLQTGEMQDGPYAGKRPSLALRQALLLDNDPVAARRAAEAAERQTAAQEEADAAAQRALRELESDARLRFRHYAAAYRLAAAIDEEFPRIKETDPRTGLILKLAGLWADAMQATGDDRIRLLRQHQQQLTSLRRSFMPMHHRRAMSNLLRPLDDMRFPPTIRVAPSLDVVALQNRLVEEGQMPPSNQIPFATSARRDELVKALEEAERQRARLEMMLAERPISDEAAAFARQRVDEAVAAAKEALEEFDGSIE